MPSPKTEDATEKPHKIIKNNIKKAPGKRKLQLIN